MRILSRMLAGLLLGAAVLAGADKNAGDIAVAGSGPGGARNLGLAPKLSFTDDSSSNFPIRGENLGDGKIASDRPTAVFFGTSHCWNTNREAERFVALAGREKDAVRFLIWTWITLPANRSRSSLASIAATSRRSPFSTPPAGRFTTSPARQ